MRVEVDHVGGLPRQAWVLQCREGRIDGLLGSNVRLTDHGFFEGGWALTPEPEALRVDGIHFGSGASWKSGRLTLISPSHSLESIWIAQAAGELWAANSLPLLIAATRPEGFDIWRARLAIRSLLDGLGTYARDIYKGTDIAIHRFANAFVTMEDSGRLLERQQQQAATFDTYERYVDFLSRALSEARASFGGGIAVYLSRGYDSTAAAAIASALGPVNAICIDRTAAGDADDGSAISSALGMPSTVVKRQDRPSRLLPQADGNVAFETISASEYDDVFEFYCGVHMSDECLRVPDEMVASRAVVTGWYGDSMWGLDGEPSRDLTRDHRSSAGIGLGEFRLRTGFMHVPIAALAFNRSHVVRAIGESDAMQPWRLGTDYDRPIPRRIAEEAGVPRDAFGTRKMFTATQVANLRQIAPILFDMQVARYAPAIADWPFTRHQPALAAGIA